MPLYVIPDLFISSHLLCTVKVVKLISNAKHIKFTYKFYNTKFFYLSKISELLLWEVLIKIFFFHLKKKAYSNKTKRLLKRVCLGNLKA